MHLVAPEKLVSAPARTSPCNLILIGNQYVNKPEDFEELARWIQEADPRVNVHIWKDEASLSRRCRWALRRTMLFSPVKALKFKLLRGSVFQGGALTKSEEFDALTRAGVAVPSYVVLTEDRPTTDLAHLGEYVVVKPDRGGRGANVRVMRASKVHWEEDDESRCAGKSSKTIAQKFIYTGPWPVSYRITSLFGNALFALKVEASHDRPPLSGPEAFKKTSGLSIVSNSKRCTFCYTDDAEVIKFAEDAHRAFPTIPLLGVDVIRDAATGKLYVLEVNSGGYVWHFTSRMGLNVQQQFGLNFESQFNGRRKAAKILAAKAMEAAV
jgi:hypothetical protein